MAKIWHGIKERQRLAWRQHQRRNGIMKMAWQKNIELSKKRLSKHEKGIAKHQAASAAAK